MTSEMQLKKLSLHIGDGVLHVQVTITNSSTRELPPGGLRCIADGTDGLSIKLSFPHLWPVAAGESVALLAHVPRLSWLEVKRIHSFKYMDLSGQSLPIKGDARIGNLGGVTLENLG